MTATLGKKQRGGVAAVLVKRPVSAISVTVERLGSDSPEVQEPFSAVLLFSERSESSYMGQSRD